MKKQRLMIIAPALLMSLMALGCTSNPVTETYTVKFDTNGGSVINDVTVNKGEKLTRPTNPTKSGYVFVDWYKEKTFENIYNFDEPVNSNLTIYAKWDEAYTITFNTNGGSTISDVTVNKGEKLTKPTNPTKVGYIFTGWYKEEGLENLYNFDDIVSSSFTLYAKWSDHYTVTFNTNGGSEIEQATVQAGNKLTKPTDPTKSFYSFDTWYIDEDCSKEYNFDDVVTQDLILYAKWNFTGEIKDIADLKKIISTVSYESGTRNFTLTAERTQGEETYKIEFKANKGSSSLVEDMGSYGKMTTREHLIENMDMLACHWAFSSSYTGIDLMSKTSSKLESENYLLGRLIQLPSQTDLIFDYDEETLTSTVTSYLGQSKTCDFIFYLKEIDGNVLIDKIDYENNDTSSSEMNGDFIFSNYGTTVIDIPETKYIKMSTNKGTAENPSYQVEFESLSTGKGTSGYYSNEFILQGDVPENETSGFQTGCYFYVKDEDNTIVSNRKTAKVYKTYETEEEVSGVMTKVKKTVLLEAGTYSSGSGNYQIIDDYIWIYNIPDSIGGISGLYSFKFCPNIDAATEDDPATLTAYVTNAAPTI